MHLWLIFIAFADILFVINAISDSDYYEDYINYNVLHRVPSDSDESIELDDYDRDETLYQNAIADKLKPVQYDPLYSMDDEEVFAMEKKSFTPHRDPNKDRGNRNAEAKFAHDTVQCKTDWIAVDLYDVFKTNRQQTEFHTSSMQLRNGVCRKVSPHHQLYVPYPCAHFPNNQGERLCYFRGNTCETLKKAVYIWKRDIKENGEKGPWYTKGIDWNVGCNCHYEFHHHYD